MNKLLLSLIMLVNTFVSLYAGDFLVVSQRGDLKLWDGKKLTGIVPEEISFYEDIGSIFFAEKSPELYLYASIISGKVYRIGVSDYLKHKQGKGYEPYETGQANVYELYHDKSNEYPVMEEDISNSNAPASFYYMKDRKKTTVLPENVLFITHIIGPSLGVPEASEKLIRKYPILKSVLKDYKNDKWLLVSKSESVTIYQRILYTVTKTGQKFRATLLIYNELIKKWELKQLEEAASSFVYNDASAIMGKDDYKTDKSSGSENPSGNWYVYVPEKDLFLQYDFKSLKDYKKLEVLNAVGNNVYFTRGNDVLKLEITDNADKMPVELFKLPDSREKVAGIFPLPEENKK